MKCIKSKRYYFLFAQFKVFHIKKKSDNFASLCITEERPVCKSLLRGRNSCRALTAIKLCVLVPSFAVCGCWPRLGSIFGNTSFFFSGCGGFSGMKHPLVVHLRATCQQRETHQAMNN